MQTQSVQLIDRNAVVVAVAQVVEQEQGFHGTINLSLMPISLQQTFAEYEEIVNGQMFSLLDEVEEQIAVLHLKVRFDTGYEANLEDLQISPSINRISFKVEREPVQDIAKGTMLVRTYRESK